MTTRTRNMRLYKKKIVGKIIMSECQPSSAVVNRAEAAKALPLRPSFYLPYLM